MNIWKLSTVTLAGALALSTGAAFAPMAHADQPHMQKARELLNAALVELKNAAPDKGGWRDKAIQTTGTAITQVESGIKYAN